MASVPITAQQEYLPFRGVLNDTSSYLPLDPASKEIRYLRLQPGPPHSPIVCTLGYTVLDKDASDRVAYRALSYCWGSIDDTVEIVLRCPVAKMSDTFTDQRFHVTRNLEAALRALRMPHEPRVLWIDALVIKQNDPREKTHQVGLMDLVYSMAEEVVVWLGEADVDSAVVARCCSMVQEKLKDVTEANHRDPEGILCNVPRLRIWSVIRECINEHQASRDPAEYPKHDLSLGILRFCGTIDRFLSRPWFYRIWVYQELLLAPKDSLDRFKVTVLVGNDSFRWHDLIEFLGTIPKYLLYTNRYEHLTSFSRAWYRATRSPRDDLRTFETYFSETRHFRASDPRDKLFALLHLGADTQDNRFLIPDYGKSLESVILEFSKCGLHLPLKIKTPPVNSAADYDPTNEHSETEFYFNFWYLNTDDRFSDTDSLVHACAFPFRGQMIHRVPNSASQIRVPGYDGQFYQRELFRLIQKKDCMDATKIVALCLRDLISLLRRQTGETGFLVLFKNLLRLLGVRETAISTSWMAFGKLYFNDMSSDWPDTDDENALWDLVDLQRRVWKLNTGAFYTCGNKIILTRCGVRGVQPNDIIVRLPGNTGCFLMTPDFQHMESSLGEPESGSKFDESLLERSLSNSKCQEYLFRGACFLFPSWENAMACITGDDTQDLMMRIDQHT